MNMTIEPGGDGTLILRQPAGILRYVIGMPLLGFGGLLAFGTLSSPILTLRDQGWDAWPEALAGCFIMGLFAALTLPLGWWVALSRHWKVLDREDGQVVEVSDWWLGSSRKATALQEFKSVWVGTDALDSSSSSQKSGPPTLVEMVKLLPRNPHAVAAIDLGWTADGQHAEALRIAREIADWLPLPLVDGQEIES